MNPTMDVFNNAELGDIRVITRDSGYWFVAMDVAKCIGYSDTSAMCGLCRKSDKYVVTKYGSDVSSECNNLMEGKTSCITLISEPGLYRIFAKCNLPKCEQFEHWVFDDVLPSIRKNGVYAAPTAVQSMSNEELMAKAILAAQSTIERIQRERDEAIRDKAKISTKREATLMGKCGLQAKKIDCLTKENQELRDENNALRDIKPGYTTKSIPWIKQYFTPNAVNGELKIDVYNRLGSCLRNLCQEMGVHILERDKILDERTGNRLCVWPMKVVDEMKRRIETKDKTDKYVDFMKYYLKPSLRREILKGA